MKTLRDLSVPDAIYVNGREAQVSDQIQLFLDTVNIPGFPAFIYGIITSVSKVKCANETSYDVEYDPADLDGAATALRPDDVVDWAVTDGLDTEIAARIAGDAALEVLIDSETTARTNADGAIAGLVDDEAGFRIAGDAALQNQIDALPTEDITFSGVVTFSNEDPTIFAGTVYSQNGLFVQGNGNILGDLEVGGNFIATSGSFAGITVNGPTVLNGTLSFVPAFSATPSSNGRVIFEATSNTQLTVKYKGLDGVVRSNILTLS